MANNPLFNGAPGTLDETVIRPEHDNPHFGWRWLVSGGYLLLAAAFIFFILFYQRTRELGAGVDIFLDPLMIPVYCCAVAAFLLLLRTQVGWVMATIIVSAIIVLSAIGLIVQFIPAIEPVARGRGGRMLSSTVSTLLACGVFYLLSHPRLRAGFRIPQSWIRRCITLGGAIGAGIGMWLIWLVTTYGSEVNVF